MTSYSGRVQITDRLALDSNLSYGGSWSPTPVSLPIDFKGGAATTIVSLSIPGGTLGPNGYIDISVMGQHSLTATGAVTFGTSSGGGVATQNLTGGTTYFLEGLVRIQGENSETSQKTMQRITAGRTANAPQGPYLLLTSSPGVDTGSDWTETVFIQSSLGAATGLANISTVLVQAYYLP